MRGLDHEGAKTLDHEGAKTAKDAKREDHEGVRRGESPSCASSPSRLRDPNTADVARHDRMIALVTQMLDLHARLAAEGVPHEVTALRRRIDITDRQIDSLVYDLYGLTSEEIKVVEGA